MNSKDKILTKLFKKMFGKLSLDEQQEIMTDLENAKQATQKEDAPVRYSQHQDEPMTGASDSWK